MRLGGGEGGSEGTCPPPLYLRTYINCVSLEYESRLYHYLPYTFNLLSVGTKADSTPAKEKLPIIGLQPFLCGQEHRLDPG